MKTIIAIPETKEEWKDLWTKNKKKIVGGAVAVGGFIAGAVLTHGKLWDKDDPSCDSDTAGYLPESEDYNEGSDDCPFEDEAEEESNETEADAE